MVLILTDIQFETQNACFQTSASTLYMGKSEHKKYNQNKTRRHKVD